MRLMTLVWDGRARGRGYHGEQYGNERLEEIVKGHATTTTVAGGFDGCGKWSSRLFTTN